MDDRIDTAKERERMDALDAARALIGPLIGYTPGPWEAAIYDDVGFINVPPGVGFEQGDFKPGDARLIASAPDLRDMVATLADALEAEREENVRLRGNVRAMTRQLELIANHRRSCHRYDDDMGHARRDFDSEDWKLIEYAARAALIDTATLNPEGIE